MALNKTKSNNSWLLVNKSNNPHYDFSFEYIDRGIKKLSISLSFNLEPEFFSDSAQKTIQDIENLSINSESEFFFDSAQTIIQDIENLFINSELEYFSDSDPDSELEFLLQLETRLIFYK